ncbi:cysteine synthase family protein [Xenorhabdus sp. 12]|uniref:cysteine synthase n=1 Tax=Xenorhabdus santafensis TaxID=2582833 RepID=A0ABU4SCT8_9GAMM|nr:cysteine synthase family protein [Xenorhabdus sp. 12]MDX7988607.1 cysteine synthase family protein [Xenorhabdus sp. 12]
MKLNYFFTNELPNIIKLKENLYCVYFPLMKLLPAKYILNEAEEKGLLQKGDKIVESTSGTFGLALALLCAERGYNLILVGDSSIDSYLSARLKNLNVRIELIDKTIEEKEGPQKARLEKVNEIVAQENAFWPQQYFNQGNIKSYQIVAETIHQVLGHVDILCGTVGTGGSISGISKGFREYNSQLFTVGIDTHHSVLFGHKNGKRLLRGLGNSIIPGNILYEEFNEIHWVSAAEAFLSSREIYKQHGLFMGGTSGAAYLVANWYAQNNPDKIIITVFPDEGHRYFDTIYNDEWVKSIPNWNKTPFDELAPIAVKYPDEELQNWSMFNWNRRERM